MQKVHTNPEESVKIHKILGSKVSVPIHYATFRLSLETYTQPVQDLYKAMQDHNVQKNEFAVLKHGAFLQYNNSKDFYTGFIKDKK